MQIEIAFHKALEFVLIQPILEVDQKTTPSKPDLENPLFNTLKAHSNLPI